jgi:uncharacterized protein/heat shock protein HslJ
MVDKIGHRMRKVMGFVVLPVLGALFSLPVLVGAADSRAGLGGTSWELVEFQSMDDATGTISPHAGQRYSMRFGADGSAAFVLNCNHGTTTYTTTVSSSESGGISFGALGMTRALCPPPSMDEKIAADLEYVRSYFIRDGRLFLSLMADGGIYVFEPTPADMLSTQSGRAQIEPSFNCDKAESSAERAVCDSDQLAMLDNEVARLYQLALATPELDIARENELKAYQRGWIKGRDDCWKDAKGLPVCIAREYAIRIHELRMSYANARTDDESGISTGPFAYHCEGLDALISAVFIQSDAPMVSLAWRDSWRALQRTSSASGAKYEADYSMSGSYVFWTKGEEAVFSRPGEAETHCSVEATG